MIVRRALVAGSLLALVVAASALAQSAEVQATIDGNTVQGTYTVEGGRPAFVVGFQLDPAASGNVVGFTCGAGSTTKLNGGPGGSPECLFSKAVTSAPFTLTGTTAWPNSLTVTPFTSFDNATYVIDSPVVIAAAAPAASQSSQSSSSSSSAAAPASDSAQVAAPVPATSATSTPGESRSWLWALLLGAGLVIATTGVVVKIRTVDDDIQEAFDNLAPPSLDPAGPTDALSGILDGLAGRAAETPSNEGPEPTIPHTVEKPGPALVADPSAPSDEPYEPPPPMPDDVAQRQLWYDRAQERYDEGLAQMPPPARKKRVGLSDQDKATLEHDIADLKRQKAELYTWQTADPNEYTGAAALFVEITGNPFTLATNLLGNKEHKLDEMIARREKQLADGTKSADPVADDKATVEASLAQHQADRDAFVSYLPDRLKFYAGEWWDCANGDPIAKDRDRLHTREVLAVDPDAYLWVPRDNVKDLYKDRDMLRHWIADVEAGKADGDVAQLKAYLQIRDDEIWIYEHEGIDKLNRVNRDLSAAIGDQAIAAAPMPIAEIAHQIWPKVKAALGKKPPPRRKGTAPPPTKVPVVAERPPEVDPFGSGKASRTPVDEVNTIAVYVHATDAWVATFPEIRPERVKTAQSIKVKVTDQAGLNEHWTTVKGSAPPDEYPGVRFTAADGTQTIVTTTDNPHIAAHETGHTFQNPELKALGGPVFEAFNEKFTEDLCTKYKTKATDMRPSSYATNGNVAAVRQMERLVDPKVIREANFGKGKAEIDAFKTALDKATRPGTADHVLWLMNNGHGWDAAAYLDFFAERAGK